MEGMESCVNADGCKLYIVCLCVCAADSTESQADLDCHIRRLGPMSPTQSKHELYRSIQKGGRIPEHGLQLSTANGRRGQSLYELYLCELL